MDVVTCPMTDEKTLAGHVIWNLEDRAAFLRAKIFKVTLKTTKTQMDKEYSYGPSYTSHVCTEITPFKRMYNPTEIASSNL